jgi:CO dehydrogenase maturation factor
MKMSVCGKGGSGKSAIVALIANEMQQRGHQVVVVDSDESNPGLYRMLGLDKRPVPLIELVGGRKNVFQAISGRSESFPSILKQEEIPIVDILPEYIVGTNGIKLVCIGKILQSLEGCACPMGALSREFLKRLSLKEGEVAIVDMEAGIEHFGRGVETSIDSVLIVVEPSLDSLELAEKINNLAIEVGIDRVSAVLNKVPSEKLAFKLRDELSKKKVSIIGSIKYQTEIFQASLDGLPIYKSKVPGEMGEIVDSLLSLEPY